MRTITLTAYRRPLYTAKAIVALAHCRRLDEFGALIIALDPGFPDVEKVCVEAGQLLADHGVIDVHLYANQERLGVGENSGAVLSKAFERHNSDFNVFIEDDAILSPNALELALWFEENFGGQSSPYALLSMCDHAYQGRPYMEDYLMESGKITSPFAWCCTRHQYFAMKPHWNKKACYPVGWDFSLTFALRAMRKKVLYPALSRCQNIGRENGEHETPETFDATQRNIAYTSGIEVPEFQVQETILEEDLFTIDPWMVDEYVSLLEGGDR